MIQSLGWEEWDKKSKIVVITLVTLCIFIGLDPVVYEGLQFLPSEISLNNAQSLHRSNEAHDGKYYWANMAVNLGPMF